jgi:AAA15 family ATPase/GTPase
MENLIQVPQYALLRTAAVYGANASGKTKLFQAFNFMREVVLTSADAQSNNWQKSYAPFLLDTYSADQPSVFEVVFLMDDIQYRYGFELNGERIIAEWLFRKRSKEIKVLEFDGGPSVYYNEKYINRKIINNLEDAKMFRANSLIISSLSLWNDALSLNILNWFRRNNIISASLNTMAPRILTALELPKMKAKMIEFLRSADLGIFDVTPNEISIEDLPDEIKRMLPEDAINGPIVSGISISHKRYDKQHLPAGYVKLSLEKDESYGTYRFLSLAGPIINALETGSVLWIDEIDNGLHYDLVRALVSLFQDEKINVHNAQLIINTHNISLIDDADLFRRDQIFIVKKNRYGEANLIPVSDFSLRESAKVGKLYREGRFGGVPYLEKLGININK